MKIFKWNIKMFWKDYVSTKGLWKAYIEIHSSTTDEVDESTKVLTAINNHLRDNCGELIYNLNGGKWETRPKQIIEIIEKDRYETY